MSDVAKQAGVATGTAYVHYESKEALLFAAYVEVKRELGDAVAGLIDPAASPHDRFVQLWLGVYRTLAADPDRARFLVQMDSSPYAAEAHALAIARGDDAMVAQAMAEDIVDRLAPLSLELLYELGIAPAVRLAAGLGSDGTRPKPAAVRTMAEACWRAMTIG